MFSHLKRRIGIFTAVAVLAALVPALATSTASAAPLTTAAAGSDPATYVACPTGSAAAAGFTDTTSTDVDCIASYGITTGVTATTYEPSSNIPRWQMALYLTRTATASGVTLGDGSDQGFTDISGESAAIQTAINQIKQLGVTTGTTATTYSPADNVTREQMAMFIERLLDSVGVGPAGSADDDSDVDVAAETYVNGTTATYNYTDVDSGAVTFEGHNAIVEMYNLGITGDAKTVSTFSPATAITRADMATWLTNALAHSNTRPEGLHIQATYNACYGACTTAAHALHVSNRDAAFAGVAGTLVDVLGWDATDVVAAPDDAAFTAAGAVDDALELSSGGKEGVIENSDYVTDQSGNLLILQSGITSLAQATESTTTTYYAWTGAVGTYYDNDTTTNSSTTVTASLDGDHLHVGTSNPYANLTTGTLLTANTHAAYEAKKGTTITYTLQLRYTTGTAARNVARAGCYINVASSTGTYGSTATAITNTTLVTDATGTATFTATEADVTAGDGNDTVIRAQYMVFSAGAANVLASVACPTTFTVTQGATGATDGTADLALKWSDVARDNNSVTLAAAAPDVAATAVGTGATNTMTAVSYDQYGTGVASASLGLTIDQANPQWGIGASTLPTFTVTRTTNSSGSATFGINRDAGTSAATTFRVNDDEDNTASKIVYWTVTPVDAALEGADATTNPVTYACDTAWSKNAAATGETMARMVTVDNAADSMVVDLGYYDGTAAAHKIVKYTWDSNDQFNIAGVAQTQAGWEYNRSLLLNADGSLATADDIDGGSTNDCALTVKTTSSASTYSIP